MSGPTSAARTDPLAVVPIGLRVEGRRILVVGAGPIAARKAAVYLAQGARVTVVAPDHGPAMGRLAVAERIHRPFEPSDLDDVWLVVAATGRPSVDGAVFREAERRRIWCNAADDPAHCSVILPAVARAGDITISISTGGRSPAVASWLRRRIEELLDADTLAIADACARVRSDVRAIGLSTEVRGWEEVLDADPARLIDAGDTSLLEQRLRDAVIGGRA